MDTFGATVSLYLARSPLYLVWLAGIVAALFYWRRYPRVSLLAVVALAILFLNDLLGTALQMSLPRLLIGRGFPIRQTGIAATVMFFLQCLVDAAAFGILLAAVYSSRREHAVKAGG